MCESCVKVAFDMMIDKAMQIKQMQDNLGVSLIGDDVSILIYGIDNLFEIANELETEVCETGYRTDDCIKIGFKYRDVSFIRYVSEAEFDEIKGKIVCSK